MQKSRRVREQNAHILPQILLNLFFLTVKCHFNKVRNREIQNNISFRDTYIYGETKFLSKGKIHKIQVSSELSEKRMMARNIRGDTKISTEFYTEIRQWIQDCVFYY